MCLRKSGLPGGQKHVTVTPRRMGARFVYAFGGAGLLTVVTAVTGLVGVRLNSRVLLGLYSSLLVVMLLGQALVAIALFADDAWTKRLPPDTTGEAKKVIVAPLPFRSPGATCEAEIVTIACTSCRVAPSPRPRL